MAVKSVAQFKHAIQNAATPTGREKTGKVNGEEMAAALKKLPATKVGASAAQTLLDAGTTKMDAAAKAALKSFIKHASGDKSTHGTGVKTFESVADVKRSLKTFDFRDQIVSAAFGHLRSKSSSFELGDVRKSGDGFDIDARSVHWQTRLLQKEVTVHINKAGVPTKAVEGDALSALAAKLKADPMLLRELAMKERGSLTRSDTVLFN